MSRGPRLFDAIIIWFAIAVIAVVAYNVLK